MNKKILIICKAFYPENSPRAFRAAELAKQFARDGHSVTVVLPDKGIDYSEFCQKHQIEVQSMGKLTFPEINSSKSGLSGLFLRVLRRLLLQLVEYPDIELMLKAKRYLKKQKGYDLLVSIAVPFPIHWGVAWAWHGKAPVAGTWVADCGDPYMGNKTDSFRKLFYFKYLEKWFCRKADFITVPTSGSINGYYQEFRNKIRVIPQGFDFNETRAEESFEKNPIPVFAYAGGFIPGIRDPRPFLKFLAESELDYRFILYTNDNSLIEPYIEASGNRIELRNYIPRTELLKELRKMDFLINFNNGTNVQTPSKLIDYALTGRPILSLDSAKFEKDVFMEFMEGNFEKRYVISDIDQYNIVNVARRFLGLAK